MNSRPLECDLREPALKFCLLPIFMSRFRSMYGKKRRKISPTICSSCLNSFDVFFVLNSKGVGTKGTECTRTQQKSILVLKIYFSLLILIIYLLVDRPVPLY